MSVSKRGQNVLRAPVFYKATHGTNHSVSRHYMGIQCC